MKRAIRVVGTDLVFELGRVVEVDVPKRFVMLEETKNGTFRLTYTKSLFPDGTKAITGAITVVREE